MCEQVRRLTWTAGLRAFTDTQEGTPPPERVAAFLVTVPRRVVVTERTDGDDTCRAKNMIKLGVTRVRSALQCRTLPITYVEHLQKVLFRFTARIFSGSVTSQRPVRGFGEKPCKATHRDLQVPLQICKYRKIETIFFCPGIWAILEWCQCADNCPFVLHWPGGL